MKWIAQNGHRFAVHKGLSRLRSRLDWPVAHAECHLHGLGALQEHSSSRNSVMRHAHVQEQSDRVCNVGLLVLMAHAGQPCRGLSERVTAATASKPLVALGWHCGTVNSHLPMLEVRVKQESKWVNYF